MPTGPTRRALPTINSAVKNAATQTGLTNVKILELQRAFNGRRLCENTVGLLEEKGLPYWTQRGRGRPDRVVPADPHRHRRRGTDYYIQESLHPNYWAQLALRNCTRQAYNGGAPRGGTCVRTANGKNANGEPVMTLQ